MTETPEPNDTGISLFYLDVIIEQIFSVKIAQCLQVRGSFGSIEAPKSKTQALKGFIRLSAIQKSRKKNK